MTTFQLKVQRIGAECWFELRWGKGQSLQATLPYPPELSLYYEEWRQAYLSFYQTSQRGRVVESGGLSAFPADWRTKLVQAEAKLQSVFQPWLRSGELFEIRQAIAQTQSSSGQPSSPIDLLLACRSSELERLPWESWDLGADFASSCPIRIARTPSNIRASATILQPQLSRRRIRVLAILGDETGLDFQADRAAITSLKPLADLHFVERQPQHDPASFKDTICHAIADARGWDMLFFVGHSDETTHTGGALRIAPGVELQLSEIAPKLAIARSKGLKFALFNSCSGLDLAHSLIDLGLSQVAIMREPIHNRAAQLFLMQFIQALTQFRDVHDAMRLACKHLKEVDSLAYPSAHLVPSLFRHPEALLFRLEPVGLKQALQRWKPSRREGIAIVTLSLLSLLHPVQNVLLDQRMFVQAIYRDLTGQLPTQPPPIALVHIDEASLAKTNIKNRNPIDRRYLAQVIDRLSDSKPAVVGIDYVLDTQQPGNDRRLAQAVQTAIAQNRTYFVFAALANDHTSAPETGVLPETRIALPQWSLQGNILTYSPLLVNLPPMQGCRQTCPFAYVVSMAALAGNNPNSLNAPLPQLSHSADLRTQLLTFIQRNRTAGSAFYFLSQAHLPSIATFSELLWQTWLQPIHDFSIPPEVIYTRMEDSSSKD